MRLQLPSDADRLDVELYNCLVKGTNEPQTTAHIYAQIKDPVDKFLMAFVFEMGNTRRDAEVAVGLSKATIWKRIKNLKKEVEGYAKDRNLI